MQLAEARRRARAHPADVVGAPWPGRRRRPARSPDSSTSASREALAAMWSDGLGERQPRRLRQAGHDRGGEAAGHVDAGADRAPAEGQLAHARQRAPRAARRPARPAWRSRRAPGPGSPAWRPSGACGRPSPRRRSCGRLAPQRRGQVRRARAAGGRARRTAAATWMAAGNWSFDDSGAFTSSLGCTGPAESLGRQRRPAPR